MSLSKVRKILIFQRSQISDNFALCSANPVQFLRTPDPAQCSRFPLQTKLYQFSTFMTIWIQKARLIPPLYVSTGQRTWLPRASLVEKSWLFPGSVPHHLESAHLAPHSGRQVTSQTIHTLSNCKREMEAGNAAVTTFTLSTSSSSSLPMSIPGNVHPDPFLELEALLSHNFSQYPCACPELGWQRGGSGRSPSPNLSHTIWSLYLNHGERVSVPTPWTPPGKSDQSLLPQTLKTLMGCGFGKPQSGCLRCRA